MSIDGMHKINTQGQTIDSVNTKTTSKIEGKITIPEVNKENKTETLDFTNISPFAKNIDKTTSEVKVSQADFKYNKGGLKIPVFYQDDYEDVKLGPSNIKVSGCGYTSCAMVASYLSGEKITPADIAKWGENYYIPGQGMDWSLIPEVAKHYDLGKVKEAYFVEDAIEALKEGKPVICSQGPGLFTSEGHIIVLRGIDENGNILVNDPNIENAEGKDFKNRSFTPNEIRSAVQYWIFEGKQE